MEWVPTKDIKNQKQSTCSDYCMMNHIPERFARMQNKKKVVIVFDDFAEEESRNIGFDTNQVFKK